MEEWSPIETFRDRGSAESLALMLRAEGVPTLVRASGVVGIVESAFQVLVDPSLEHRARLLLAQTVSDGELDFLATGKLRSRESE
jgi:hypothetical protein